MEPLTSFGAGLGGAILPTALLILFIRSQVASIRTEMSVVKGDVKGAEDSLETKVNLGDCGGQPCDEVKVLNEVLQGPPGGTGMVAQLDNVEKVVMEIREHQKNGG